MDRHFATVKCGFPGCFAREVQLGQKAALYCRVSTIAADAEVLARFIFRFVKRPHRGGLANGREAKMCLQ